MQFERVEKVTIVGDVSQSVDNYGGRHKIRRSIAHVNDRLVYFL